MHHGNRKFRAGLRIHHDVAGIYGDIRNQDRLFQRCSGAHDALGRGGAQSALHTLSVFHVHAMAKNLLLFVIEHNAQNLVINHALGLLGRAAQQFFDVQDGAHLAPHFA